MPPPALLRDRQVSQFFEAEGSTWVFIGSEDGIALLRVSDGPHGARASSVCARDDQGTDALSASTDLEVGEAVVVIPRGSRGAIGDGSTEGSLLLSDSAIARQRDRTWVLFVKGISDSLGCSGGALCELCNRGIYRATSTDLLHWSSLERIAFRASVPDAATTAEGVVRVYWQDFGPACDAGDQMLAQRAPILGAREDDGGVLSDPVPVTFVDEPFETDTHLHYPTNGNPVQLPDASAVTAFEACMSAP